MWNPGADSSHSDDIDHRAVDQAVCPLCHFRATNADPIAPMIASVADLEVHLDALVRSAWAGGLDTEVIVQVLRDELVFAAEMGHTGRQFIVQLIDLGPQAIVSAQLSRAEQHAAPSGRRGAP
jgi:hypothetical protein